MRMRSTLLILLCLVAAPAFAGQNGSVSDDRFQAALGLARVKRDAGDLKAARRYFEDARRLRPLDVSQLAEYFWVLAGQDASAALLVGRAVLAMDPGRHDVRDRTITEALAVADEAGIVALADEGRKHEPRAALWPRRAAESLLRQGHPGQAAAAYQLAAKSPDAIVDDRVGLAVSLEAAKRYAEAAEAWRNVPPAARAGKIDLEHSRLRALALGGDASAGPELDAWLASNPADDEMRALAVDVWIHAGQPARALAVAAPLTGDDWMRRKAALARAAGMRDAAIAAFDRLGTRNLTIGDRLALSELLLEAGKTERAAGLLGGLASGPLKCNQHVLELIDRIPGERGTHLLLEAIKPPQCNQRTTWILRAIDRAVAASAHAVALDLIGRLPSPTASTADMRRLMGQLQLWTGKAREATTTLEAILVATPDDTIAREALVDAYRAQQRPTEAWRVAEPLVTLDTLGQERRLMLAELALEVERPVVVSRLVGAHPSGVQLIGRALLATGRPNEARSVLSSVAVDQLKPAAALSLIDALSMTAGAETARTTARSFARTTLEWRDVVARRIALEAAAGQADEARTLRTALAAIDPDTAAIADVEVALAAGRAHEALALIAKLPSDPESERVADLDAVARAGTGDVAGALAIVEGLRKHRPESVALQIREAELRYRLAPGEETLARILTIQRANPADQRIAIAAARVLAGSGRRTEALRALGAETDWASLPIEGRILAARCLQAEGHAREALALLPFTSAGSEEVASLTTLRAELVGTVDGPRAAARVLEEATKHHQGDPQLFIKWADVASTAGERVSILTEATKRFPGDAGLHARLASSAWAAGQQAAARQSATRAIEIDPHAIDAWLVLVDDAAESGATAEFDRTLRRFEAAAASDPALVIGVAEHLSAFVRAHGDPLVARVVGWLDAMTPDAPGTAFSREVARARVLAAAERWPASLAAVDAALRIDADSAAGLKLRAELLSWSGRHAEAVRAYDTYLAHQPQDVEARRQQARVAGWGGFFGEALRLYASLRAGLPNDARVAAEAEAKQAYYDGRWNAAVRAYSKWIALEPGNGEARFEQAEAMRAAGDAAAADAALMALDTTGQHRLAASALDRSRVTRSTSIAAIGDERSAEGYGGQRLLDLRTYGGAIRTGFGTQGTTVTADISGATARATDRTLRGHRAAFAGAFSISSALAVNVQATLWSLASTGGTTADGLFSGTWRTRDRWAFAAGFDRSSIFENLDTIERHLQATGPFASITYGSPTMTFDVRVSRQDLSDGNARNRSTLSVSRSLGGRVKQVRVIGWAESLDYRQTVPGYFSPDRQIRVDAGLQYTHRLSMPRFRGDRQQMLAASYLIGVDDLGTMYHHPMLTLTLEFASGLAFDARGSWIRSDVYRETSVFLGITMRPGARVQ